MGNADIMFVEEASRILDKKGRYGIAPLYLADIHFVSTSPYCNQAEDGKQKTEIRGRKSEVGGHPSEIRFAVTGVNFTG